MISHPMITKKINSVVKENGNTTTYVLDCSLEKAVPGHFIMIWMPGAGERPMGIADASPLTITVAHVGPFTEEMSKLKEGEALSFRGPLGNGFTVPKKGEKILLVGGGTGLVPLHFLAKTAKKEGAEVNIVFGARTAGLLFYKNRLKKVADSLILTTDDGSEGTKGNVLDGMKKIKTADRVYTCGPERMMAAVLKWAKEKGIPAEASLERYMKCGIGVCGSCMLGQKRVCIDGPVFSGDYLLKEPEFGKTKRDATGKEISV